MRQLFSDRTTQVELCSRVAIQLVRLSYHHQRPAPLVPSVFTRDVAASLPPDGFPMLKLALHSLASYLMLGWLSTDWLAVVVRLAREGHVFRRCWFFEYKANRRPTPRVTNRGGHSRRSELQGSFDAGHHNG